MAYILNYSGGTINISDGTLNTTSTSISLPGRNYSGYGSPVDQSLLSMLENFAYYTAGPNNPIKGQIWFDTVNNVLKYNTGVPGTPNWVTVAPVAGSPTFNNLTVTGNLNVTGNITANSITATTLTATSNIVTGVQTGITATGSTQATAFAITKDINVVSVSTTGSADGVILPSVGPGYRITVINTDTVDEVKVYPAVGGQINALAVNAAFTVTSGGKLDFVSVSATQWYTLNATYA